jgi:hypothetical protein
LLGKAAQKVNKDRKKNPSYCSTYLCFFYLVEHLIGMWQAFNWAVLPTLGNLGLRQHGCLHHHNHYLKKLRLLIIVACLTLPTVGHVIYDR